nr:predicted protein [Triticum aestivum]
MRRCITAASILLMLSSAATPPMPPTARAPFSCRAKAKLGSSTTCRHGGNGGAQAVEVLRRGLLHQVDAADVHLHGRGRQLCCNLCTRLAAFAWTSTPATPGPSARRRMLPAAVTSTLARARALITRSAPSTPRTLATCCCSTLLWFKIKWLTGLQQYY